MYIKKTGMEATKSPFIDNKRAVIQDDTQAQILRELKRQNALLEEQLAPQREQKRKEEEQERREEAHRIRIKKRREWEREREIQNLKLTKLRDEICSNRGQIEHLERQWYRHQSNYMGSAGITPYEHEQARVHNEAVAKRIKDHQDKVGSLTKQMDTILKV